MFVLLSSVTSHAATVGGISGINAFADTVSATSGTFYNWASTSMEDSTDVNMLRNDLSDQNASTYVFSMDPVASIDMAFTSTPVYNGSGNDLVLFCR